MKKNTRYSPNPYQRDDLIDALDDRYSKLCDTELCEEANKILDAHNASDDDTGQEGYCETMSNEDIEAAVAELDELIATLIVNSATQASGRCDWKECAQDAIDNLERQELHEILKNFIHHFSEDDVERLFKLSGYDEPASEYYY